MSDFDENNFGPEISPEPEAPNAYDQEPTPAEETSTDLNQEVESAPESESPDFETTSAVAEDNYNYQIPEQPYVVQPQNSETAGNVEIVPRKKTPKWLFALIGLIIGVILITVAVFTIPSLSNAFALATMSPAKYYARVEKANMSGTIDTVSKSYGKSVTAYTKAEDGKNVQVAKKANMKLTLSNELASMIGLDSIQPIEANIQSDISSKKLKSMIELLYNGKTLATTSTYMDLATSDIYVQVKELSEKYLLISQDSLATYEDGIDTAQIQSNAQKLITDNILTEKILNTLLKKYGNLALSKVTTVSLEKKSDLKVSDLTSKNTKITVTLSQEDLINMATVILESAEDDQDIIKLCEDSKLCTKAEYKTGINYALVQLDTLKTSAFLDEPVEMTVWVNNRGIIIGREFNISSEGSTIKAGYVQSGQSSKLGFKGWLTVDDVPYLSLEGTCSTKSKKISGDMKLSIATDESGVSNYNLNVSFKDFQMINEEKGYFNGTASITSDTLATMALNLTAKAEKTTQSLALDILNGKTNMATLSMKMEDGKYEDFTMPAKENVCDISTDMDTYMASADLESFVKNIEDVLDMEFINPYLDSLLYGYDSSSTDDSSSYDDSLEASTTTDDTTMSASDIVLPAGVTADEDGYFSYEPDYDTIMAAGVGSTGYPMFTLYAADYLDGFRTLVADTYASKLIEVEPSMYNYISGCIDGDNSYEYNSFTTTNTWNNEDNYNQYIQFSKDTVTDQIMTVTISDTDIDRGREFAVDTVALLNGGLDASDKKQLISTLTVADGEEYAEANYDNYYIYYYNYDDYGTFTIGALSNN